MRNQILTSMYIQEQTSKLKNDLQQDEVQAQTLCKQAAALSASSPVHTSDARCYSLKPRRSAADCKQHTCDSTEQ